MSNEEKILSLLTKMQSDIDSMKTDIKTLKHNDNPQPKKKVLTAEERFAIFDRMANLLNDEEKDALGEYMAAEEARKVALYG